MRPRHQAITIAVLCSLGLGSCGEESDPRRAECERYTRDTSPEFYDQGGAVREAAIDGCLATDGPVPGSGSSGPQSSAPTETFEAEPPEPEGAAPEPGPAIAVEGPFNTHFEISIVQVEMVPTNGGATVRAVLRVANIGDLRPREPLGAIYQAFALDVEPEDLIDPARDASDPDKDGDGRTELDMSVQEGHLTDMIPAGGSIDVEFTPYYTFDESVTPGEIEIQVYGRLLTPP